MTERRGGPRGRWDLAAPALLLAVLMCLSAGASSEAAEGDLDGAFNAVAVAWENGRAISPAHRAHAVDMALQADGKIVVAGYSPTVHVPDLVLVRFCRNGRLDDGVNCGPGGFGDAGIVFTLDTGVITGVAIQADGKIVVAGRKSDGGAGFIVLVRYCTDGRLDDGVNCGTGFGVGGKVRDSSADGAGGLAIQPDGKIVVGAGTLNAALVRYCPTGSLDDGINCGGAGFGTGGVVDTGWDYGGQASQTRVALQADGKILLLGGSILARFCADGRVDDGVNCGGGGFGTGGVYSGYVSPAGRLAVQPDGKVVHGGYRDTGAGIGFFVARLCAHGRLDDGLNCGGSGFGTGGEVTTLFGGGDADARDIAVTADGKVLVVGVIIDPNDVHAGVVLVRYCADGRLDDGVACGADGFGVFVGISLHDPPGTEVWSAVAISADGRILLAGCVNCFGYSALIEASVTLLGICSNGLPDDGTNCGLIVSSLGPITTHIRGHDQAHAIALQPDGKIVLAGGADMTGSNAADFAVVRYCPDGGLDDGAVCGAGGFGVGGKVTTNFASYNDFANAVAIQPDGKIVAAGVSNQGSYQAVALARYCADGRLDDGANCGAGGFGSNGKVVTAMPGGGFSRGFATGIALQPDGKIAVAGFSGATFALARYCLDGRLDNGVNCGAGGFGGGGMVTTAFAGGGADARALALQADGKLVAAGSTGPTGSMRLALARYCPDGRLDDGVSCGAGGFGTGGKVVTAAAAGDSRALGVVVQPDGKVVAAGHAKTGANNDFVLVRYCPDGSLDNGINCGALGFGVGGIVTTAMSVGEDYAFGVALQADAKLVVVGYATPASPDLALARYCPDGRLDDGLNCGSSGFGTGGKVTLDFARGSTDVGRAVAIQPDGKILVAGDSAGDFALTRFIGVAAPPPPGGVVSHSLVIGVDPGSGSVILGPVQAGPCAQPIVNCVEFTVTGSFRVEGTIHGLLPGSLPTLGIPVADANGIQAGSRAVACDPAGASGVSSCSGVVSEAGIVPRLGAVITASVVLPDLTPPITTASYAATPGSTGWYRSGVMVTLTALDNPGGSGLDRTFYAVDEPACSPTGAGSCLTYTGPFSLAADGRHTLYFWSRDRAGNAEARQSRALNIDATPPAVTCSAQPSVLWPANHKLVPVTIAVQVSDATSGGGGFTLTAVTSSEPDNETGDGDTARDIAGFDVATPDTTGLLRAERAGSGQGRIYTLTYQAMDQAGNTAQCTTTVRAPHDGH